MVWRRKNWLAILPLFSLLVLIGVQVPCAQAQVKARITGNIDEKNVSRIAGSVSPHLAHATDMGRLPAETPMTRILLRLEPSEQQKTALTKLIQDLHNPNSAMYHKWLTPEQYAAQFGAAGEDLAAISNWLHSKGLTVTRSGRGGQYMEISGSAGQVESAFQTEMHRYQVNGETHIANATQIAIPNALTPVLKGVVSLNDFRSPSHIRNLTLLKRNKQGMLTPVPFPGAENAGTSNPQYFNQDYGGTFVSPGDLATIYDATPALKSGITGAGVSIAIVGRSNVSLSDVASFRTMFGLPANLPQIILDGPDPGILETGSNFDDEAEANLDLQYAGSIAPLATIEFVPVSSTNSSDGIILSALYIVDNAIAPIMSTSFGSCEGLMGADGNAFFNSLWEQAAAEGITSLVSSGDNGSAGCDQAFGDFPSMMGLSVNGMATTPYNVAVGGTEFLEGADNSVYWNSTNAIGTLESAKGYIPEAAWNDSCDTSLPVSLINCYYNPYGYSIASDGGGASSCLSSTVDTTTYPYTITCTAGGYAKPSWQSGAGVPDDGVRDIPDVSLAASSQHDPFPLCLDGGCQFTINSDGSTTITSMISVGGTSASTPLMASIMALVEQKNGQYLGQVNPILYQLAAKQSATACNSSNMTTPGTATACVFHDVTSGSNAVPCVGGTANCNSSDPNTDGELTGYAATAGFDLATGLGSPDVTNLINNWPTVAGAATATTLTTSSTSFVHGTAITATATVTPGSGKGTPTGDIVLLAKSNGVLVPEGASDAATLVKGTVSEKVSDLPGGSYNLYARYAGDPTYATSTSNPVALTVTPEDSTLSLSVSNPYANDPTAPVTSVTFGSPYYITAVAAGKSGQGNPTGTVTFYDGTTSLGAFQVDQSGTAMLQIGPTFQGNPYNIYLNPGAHSLTAKYSGDASFNSSTAAATLTIGKESPYGGVNVLPNSSIQTNQTVLIQVVLSSNSLSLTPTGNVTITDNGSPIATLPLVADTGLQVTSGGSQAVTSYAFKTSGSHVIGLTYAGDANFLPTTPDNVNTTTLTVTDATLPVPKVQLYDFATTIPVGTGVRYTAIVSGNGPTPTGTVTLMPQVTYYGIYDNPPYPVLLDPYGGANIDYAWMEAEPSVKIVAVYSGDANYAPATSNVITNVITQATPSITIAAAAPYVLPNSATTVTVQLSSPFMSGAPVLYGRNQLLGQVQLYDTVNGVTAPLGLPVQTVIGQGDLMQHDSSIVIAQIALPAGRHSITAQFLGNPNYTAATTASAATIVATTPDFFFSAASPTLSINSGDTGTDTMTIATILGYSGAVSFSCSGLPAGASCSFSPATVTGAGATVVSIATAAPSASAATAAIDSHAGTSLAATVVGGSALACLLLFAIPAGSWRKFVCAAMLACFLSISGCGGNGITPTTLSLSTTAVKSPAGAALTLTAILTSNRAAPYSGSVTFYDETTHTMIGQPTGFIGNQAQISVDSLSVGTHQIVAQYNGDAHTASSQSAVLNQTITGSVNATVNATSGALTHGSAVTVTVK
jgi:subtilase family serine protease